MGGGKLVLVDGSTIRAFVEQDTQFRKRVDDIFENLDKNADKVLTRAEIRPAIESLNLLEMHMGEPVKMSEDALNAFYDDVFEKFDIDANGVVDKEEFLENLKEIMLAIADGLGSFPVQMLLDDNSLLSDAAKSVRLTRSLSRYVPHPAQDEVINNPDLVQ